MWGTILASLISAIGAYAAAQKSAKAQKQIAKKAFDPSGVGTLDMGSGKERSGFAENTAWQNVGQTPELSKPDFVMQAQALPQNAIAPSPITTAMGNAPNQSELMELLRKLGAARGGGVSVYG